MYGMIQWFSRFEFVVEGMEPGSHGGAALSMEGDTGIARQITPTDAGQPQRDAPRRGGVARFPLGFQGAKVGA